MSDPANANTKINENEEKAKIFFESGMKELNNNNIQEVNKINPY